MKDGDISHARVKLGVDIFRDLFHKFTSKFKDISPNFYGFISAAFNSTSMTIPDTKSNQKKFGKPKSGRGSCKCCLLMFVKHICNRHPY